MTRVSYNLHMVNYWLTGEFYWIVHNLVHRTTNLKHSLNANLRCGCDHTSGLSSTKAPLQFCF